MTLDIDIAKTISDIINDNNLRTYDKLEKIVYNILESKKAFDPNSAIPPREIIDTINSINQNFFDDLVSEGSFYVYIRHMVQSESSRITKSRHARYYCEQDDELPLQELERTEVLAEKERERHFYPFVREWLIAENYSPKIVANSRRGSKWQNPDLVAFRMNQICGSMNLELVGVEVKLSNKNWRQDIFQAISYRTFCNRSYFAYGISGDKEDTSLRREMAYYANLYGIGILVIEPIEEENGRNGANSKQLSYAVNEIIAAPYFSVSPYHQGEALKQRYEISSLDQYVQFLAKEDS